MKKTEMPIIFDDVFLFKILDVDKLLGEPIQKKIEGDSGLKTTLESILSICSGNFQMIEQKINFQERKTHEIKSKKSRT